MSSIKKSIGKWGEDRAEEYLLQKGFRIVTRNWQNNFGEIDIIVFDQETLVFVEIRTKNSKYYGSAVESINNKKKKQLILMANIYLNYKNWWGMPYRIDVITIDKIGEKFELNHIKNAIEM